MLGILVGTAASVLHISNATSYLSDEPEACMNCHIMAPQYATWQRGSHAKVATCNDCHVPNDNYLRKYLFKAKDGARHGYMFTFRLEPQVIQVHEPGMRVIQENCIRCHENLLGDTNHLAISFDDAEAGNGTLCWDCHRQTPHGRVNSLSSVPHARVPQLSDPLPKWLSQELKEKQSIEFKNQE
ncbi:cytochrome c nitrite reductase small subunit [Persicirhabdus sediminis]|uniref:Cytochrome c nitrite reductase small subunit n=2 Tax=Persicirhabdus sediminis TaxID=454144 RepID=A0A8J7SLV7_9BACT|nr:cytochrome c nitrite reductase small subunit [Persicirhabdus sediminis]